MDVEYTTWTVEELFGELIEPIVSFLSVNSVGRLLRVCKRLSSLPSMQRIWRVVVEENFLYDAPPVGTIASQILLISSFLHLKALLTILHT
jgi:hypothetical protein